jgi:hypothetical protein
MTLAATLLALMLRADEPPPTTTGAAARAAWEAWPGTRFVQVAAPCLTPSELEARVRELAARHPGAAKLEVVGRSAEGRPIHLLEVGRGPRRVLLWSQMHGDEPSATPALLDLAHALLTSPDRGAAGRILEGTTLLMVPMLNPDGSARYRRRNAQGIDVNRDALNLATPEGRLLKQLRDRFEPELGFNLHDQDRRTTIGGTDTLATISLLGVAGDAQGTLTPGRLQARRVASAIVQALRPLVGPAIARYDEDWSPRAFGDNLTAWGTPVVLIESGGAPPADTPAGRAAASAGARVYETLSRLNVSALVAALLALTEEGASSHDPAVYEALPRNSSDRFVDVVVRGGRVVTPGPPFRADVAFDVRDDDVHRAGCAGSAPGASSIAEIGDARFLIAGREVDAAGAFVVPAFVVGVRGRAPWLTPAALDGLGALGVGRVLWERAPALGRLAGLAGRGRPRLEAVDAIPPGIVRLERSPRPAPDRGLAAVVQALGAASRSRSMDAATLLGRLLGAQRDPRALPTPLTLDEPASLLVVRPAPDAPEDVARGRVDSVFIDGRPPTEREAPRR